MNTKQLIEKAKDLPVKERALLVDSLLRSLNQVDSDLEQSWAEEARRRLKDIRDDEVETISAQTVFEDVRKKYDA